MKAIRWLVRLEIGPSPTSAELRFHVDDPKAFTAAARARAGVTSG